MTLQSRWALVCALVPFLGQGVSENVVWRWYGDGTKAAQMAGAGMSIHWAPCPHNSDVYWLGSIDLLILVSCARVRQHIRNIKGTDFCKVACLFRMPTNTPPWLSNHQNHNSSDSYSLGTVPIENKCALPGTPDHAIWASFGYPMLGCREYRCLL